MKSGILILRRKGWLPMKNEQIAEVRVSEYLVRDPDYGELIINVVKEIKDQRFLNFTYELLKSAQKKWGI